MNSLQLSSSSFGNIEISPLSENSIILMWPEIIDEKQHAKISDLEYLLRANLETKVLETIVSYNSLIVYYNFNTLPLKSLLGKITKTIETSPQQENQNTTQGHIIEIPVYYGADAGWDIESVAKQTSLTVEDVINQHSETIYRAYALGFTPGFCYLATLPKTLHLPRRSTPRTKVPKGAVAIAGQQTAIYPNQSPGGWHILGQTPIAMYQNNGDTFSSTINVGNDVKFTAISKEEFLSLGGEVMLDV